MFALRRMSPEDKPAIQEIASRIWEGSDYLPAVFDEWVADRQGEFVAALLGSRIVGCGKLTFFTPTDAWLEGLRKDPDVSEKGMADTITRYFMAKLSHRRDLTSIRFSTYIKNCASIAASERLGFRRLLALSCKVWTGKIAELEALPGGTHRGAVEPVFDKRLVFDFLDSSRYFQNTGGLMPEGWRALPYSREIFTSRYLASGHCHGVAENGKLKGLSVFVQDTRLNRTHIKLVLIDAEDAAAAGALFDDIFAHARANASEDNEIEIILPRIQRVKEYCAAHGFRSWEQEDDFLVYELPLDSVNGSSRRSRARGPIDS